MRSLIALLVVAIGLNIAASFADASCREETLAERAPRADLVVYGRLNGDELQVRQVLKGQASGTIKVRLRAEKNVVTSVDYMPADGTDQTLFLRRQDGEWVTDACSGSHAGQPTPEERAFFALGTDGEVWTTGGEHSGKADDLVGYSPTSVAVALTALGLAALLAIALIRRLASRD